MNAKYILMTLLGAVTLTGCNQNRGYTIDPPVVLSNKPFEKGKEAELFPLTVGNEWVYEVDITYIPNAKNATRQVSKKELTFRCIRVNTVGGNTRAILEAVLEGQVNERQEWLLNKEGLYQVAIGYPRKPFTPPQPVMRFPIEAGGEFQWKGTGFVSDGQVRECRTKTQVLGEQDVDTMLGTVKAQTLQTQTIWRDGGRDWQSQNTTWWAPGIGIVRYRQESATKEAVAIQVMRLKSYSLKK